MSTDRKLTERFEKAINYYKSKNDLNKVIEIQDKYLSYYKDENNILWDWLEEIRN